MKWFIVLPFSLILLACSSNSQKIVCGAENLLIKKRGCQYVTQDGSKLTSNCKRDSIQVRSGKYSCLLTQKKERSFGKRMSFDPSYSSISIELWVKEPKENVAIVVESMLGYDQYYKIDNFKANQWNLLSHSIQLKKELFPLKIFVRNLNNDSVRVDDYSMEIFLK